MAIKHSSNYGPYQSACQAIVADRELVAALNAIQHTYPKPIPEIVLRICCEYYRDDLPKVAGDYGIYVAGPPTREVTSSVMAFLRKRKTEGWKISDSVCTALQRWLERNVTPGRYGGVDWTPEFYATHDPSNAPYLIVRDPEEIEVVMAFRERKQQRDPFDISASPVV